MLEVFVLMVLLKLLVAEVKLRISNILPLSCFFLVLKVSKVCLLIWCEARV